MAAELNDHAFRKLLIADIEHVFECKRLEVQFVAGIVIGRDRFRIRIDHDRFEAELPQSKRGVHATVIKLDALADAIGSTAENHDLALGAAPHFILGAVGRIVIRSKRFKLRGAGVDQPIGGNHAGRLSFGANLRLGNSA